jgi:hypothetical protein
MLKIVSFGFAYTAMIYVFVEKPTFVHVFLGVILYFFCLGVDWVANLESEE